MPATLSLRTAHRALLTLCLLVAAFTARAADLNTVNTLFQEVFADHVKDGYVDYPEIARDLRFGKLMEALAELDPASLPDDAARTAFWINAYNALAVKNIIDGKSPNGAMSRMGFFGANARIGGRSLDLKSIESELFAKNDDPRIHFALVPATASAPKLHAEPYLGETLDAQLEAATREFVNDKRKNRFSSALQAAKVSRIIEQHKAEFGKTDKDVLKWLARYVNDAETVKVLNRGLYKLKVMDYDASINGNSMVIKSD